MNLRLLRLIVLLIPLAGIGPARADANDQLLLDLNTATLQAYRAGRSTIQERVDPVIIVGQDLTFRWNGQVAHAPYTPRLYTVVKSLSHLYLGTVTLLQAHADDPGGSQGTWRPHLMAMRDRARALEPHLGELGLKPDTLARHRYLSDHLLAFIDRSLAEGFYTRTDLVAMARSLTPLLLASVDDAARAQIDMIHAAVQGWRAQLPPGAWDRVVVVVQGPHQPRVMNLQASYFRYALGDDDRVIYAENIFDEKGALGLLGTVMTDRELAVVAFDDRLRMERDLLGDAADAYLKQVFGKLGRRMP